ncbi:hypothetical protein [Ensifer sp. MJa1]|uniref:hypothetical protein n=1 Tax=Ensifer sp. MJa1 TaxID=2919888 RepID=UPI0030097E18
MSEPVRIAGIPTMTDGLRHDVPINPGKPGEPLFIVTNAADAMIVVADAEGHIETRTVPLIDAVTEIEMFIAKLRSSGAIEASAALKAARQASNVVGLMPNCPKPV